MTLREVTERVGTPIPSWGYAGVEWTAQVGNIYVMQGHVTEKRVAHELSHIVDGEHCPWYHFCLRVFHGLRTWRHSTVTPHEARVLIGRGWIEIDLVEAQNGP